MKPNIYLAYNQAIRENNALKYNYNIILNKLTLLEKEHNLLLKKYEKLNHKLTKENLNKQNTKTQTKYNINYNCTDELLKEPIYFITENLTKDNDNNVMDDNNSCISSLTN